MLLIYKTTHNNGRYYIGRHQTDNLNDGYLGSGIWVSNIKDKNTLSREILDEASSLDELHTLEEHYIRLHYNDPLCMNMKLASIGVTSEDVSGELHPCYDHAEHHFIHSDGREFVGTKYNLRRKFNINSSQLSELFNDNIASAKGWRIFGKDESKVLLRQRKVHHLIHLNGTEFIGTRSEFRINYPDIKRQYIDFLISGKIKSTNGWSINGTIHNKISHIDYHFCNADGRKFIGSSLDFRKIHNINQGNLSRMIRNDSKIKSIKGWRIASPQEYYECHA
jgi:hypothetical protein